MAIKPLVSTSRPENDTLSIYWFVARLARGIDLTRRRFRSHWRRCRGIACSSAGVEDSMRLTMANTLAVLCLASAGCGKPAGYDKLVPVEGKVTVDGQPLVMGMVVLQPEKLEGPEKNMPPGGWI